MNMQQKEKQNREAVVKLQKEVEERAERRQRFQEVKSPNQKLPPVSQLAAAYRPKVWEEQRRTVTLSERDVARVLQAVSKTGLMDSCIRWSNPCSMETTPEGWPLPSRKLMEEIRKLL